MSSYTYPATKESTPRELLESDLRQAEHWAGNHEREATTQRELAANADKVAKGFRDQAKALKDKLAQLPVLMPFCAHCGKQTTTMMSYNASYPYRSSRIERSEEVACTSCGFKAKGDSTTLALKYGLDGPGWY